jgi:putative nucleotidyltransferase with HDIG domain
MSGPSIDSLIDGAGELSALPDSWQRIDRVLAHPSSSTNQIADTIATDPGLSARLLRLANSPMFGIAQRVERLSQAVHLVGTRQLRELALAATVIDLVARGPWEKARIDAFLNHSIDAALLTRAIAGRRREANVERFFVIGLLHDLGTLILGRQVPEMMVQALRLVGERGQPIERVEVELLGFDHAAVAAALLTRWKLPPPLIEPVARHHQPGLAQAHRIETAAVHLATITSELVGGTGPFPVTPIDAKAWDLLGLDRGDLAGAVAEAEAQGEETRAILCGTAA